MRPETSAAPGAIGTISGDRGGRRRCCGLSTAISELTAGRRGARRDFARAGQPSAVLAATVLDVALLAAATTYSDRPVNLHDCYLDAIARERGTRVLFLSTRDLTRLGSGERP